MRRTSQAGRSEQSLLGAPGELDCWEQLTLHGGEASCIRCWCCRRSTGTWDGANGFATYRQFLPGPASLHRIWWPHPWREV